MSNKLVKILLLISIVVSLVAVVFGLLINQAKTQYATQLSAVEQSLKDAPVFLQYTSQFKKDVMEPAATIQKANKMIQNAQQELAEKTNLLEEARANIETLKAERDKLQMDLTVTAKERETFEKELTQTKEKLEGTGDELQELKTDLRGRKPKELFDKIDILESNIKSLEKQTRTLSDKLNEVQSKLDTAHVVAAEAAHAASEESNNGYSGKVVSVNKPWSFVVVDIGKNNKLIEGVELNVLRGDSSVGKVRVVSVDAATAVADILPDTLQSEIQVGDQVSSNP